MMGGTIAMRGNVSPMGEANVTGDPEACDKVFLSGMDITAVGLDVTMKVRLKREHMEWVNRRRSARAAKAVSFLNRALEYYWYGNQMQNYCSFMIRWRRCTPEQQASCGQRRGERE